MGTKTLLAILGLYKLGQFYCRGEADRRAMLFALDNFQIDIAARAAARGLICDGKEPEWARKRLDEGYRSLR